MWSGKQASRQASEQANRHAMAAAVGVREHAKVPPGDDQSKAGQNSTRLRPKAKGEGTKRAEAAEAVEAAEAQEAEGGRRWFVPGGPSHFIPYGL